jgi:hypothetical protein
MPVRTYPDSNGINDTHNGQDSEDSEQYASDTPDASMEEIDSDEFPDYFSERNGRLFPSALSSTPYPFPVDTPEQEVRYQSYVTDVFLIKVPVFCFL